jgi:antitoxin HicB
MFGASVFCRCTHYSVRSVGDGSTQCQNLNIPSSIEPLPEDEGGGFVALVPDLPGCMSDGETAEAALAAVQEAVAAWVEEATE